MRWFFNAYVSGFTGTKTLLSLLFFYSTVLCAQTDNTFTAWSAVFASYKLNDKLSIHFDGQLRSADEIEHLLSFIIRPGLNYHASKNTILTIGYAYIENRRVIEMVSDMIPEHRIWEQFIYNQRFKDTYFTSLQHRLRLEERFIGKSYPENGSLINDGSEFSLRLRYFLRAILPLVKTDDFTNGAFASLQNELFVNLDNAPTLTNGGFFDQNRAYVSLGWRFNPKFDLEAGYMYQYINGRNVNVDNNIIQLAAYLRL
ncbi:DUF2490 domain-containing protein [Flavobacterium crocinum]|uniref:DUF2490 domain-containing protein n=1 Tax=Flavobacterium crocinum TaxID=2183896 RepID=A0A2S1YRB7_9FLAO|nr:DUF2490 domain-containing protein [Flavobacterium crocinum]AWK06650.1 DUF2490 domain-containing protein [Flavobacterium crocinum]